MLNNLKYKKRLWKEVYSPIPATEFYFLELIKIYNFLCTLPEFFSFNCDNCIKENKPESEIK